MASFEDLVLMVKEGEALSAAVVFFPMHRIERIELDQPDGSLPSLSQRFADKTGREATDLLEPRAGEYKKDAARKPAMARAGKDLA